MNPRIDEENPIITFFPMALFLVARKKEITHKVAMLQQSCVRNINNCY